jgi:hypothetical protein
MSIEKYQEQQEVIATRAHHMKSALVAPVIDQGTGKFIGDRTARNEKLEGAVGGSIFESCGKSAPMIIATASNAVRAFANQRGHLPSDDLLAAAYCAVENAVKFSTGAARPGGSIFESAVALDTRDSQNAMMRDRMIALILPVMLQSVTSSMVGFIPGDFNQSEIFRIWKIAGNTFGGLTAGDRIDYRYNGQYGTMDQRFTTINGDGSKTGSANEFDKAVGMPLKKKSVRVLHDRNVVAKDDGQGNLAGTFLVGVTPVTVTGTVNYATGAIHPVFSVAPADGIAVHVAADIDIEKNPSLIPTVNHEMDSRVLYPHESAIAASTTLQALWGLRREFNLNIDNMATVNMRNLLAADKDRKHLRDMYFYAKGSYSWDMSLPTGVPMRDHYPTIRAKLLEVDAALMAANGYSGLTGIVADTKSSVIFKSLGLDDFVPAPGYVRLAQPHYVGRLFGMWDLYEDPQGTDYTTLCFGKGREISQAAYLAGDAIPAMAFKHALMGDLKYNNTLWELAYRDLQPFDGRDYLTTLTITNEG